MNKTSLLKKIAEIEDQLKESENVEIVVINRETDEVIKVIQTKKTATIRLVIRA